MQDRRTSILEVNAEDAKHERIRHSHSQQREHSASGVAAVPTPLLKSKHLASEKLTHAVRRLQLVLGSAAGGGALVKAPIPDLVGAARDNETSPAVKQPLSPLDLALNATLPFNLTLGGIQDSYQDSSFTNVTKANGTVDVNTETGGNNGETMNLTNTTDIPKNTVNDVDGASEEQPKTGEKQQTDNTSTVEENKGEAQLNTGDHSGDKDDAEKTEPKKPDEDAGKAPTDKANIDFGQLDKLINNSTVPNNDDSPKENEKDDKSGALDPKDGAKPDEKFPPKKKKPPTTPNRPAYTPSRPATSEKTIRCDSNSSKVDLYLCKAAAQIDTHPIAFLTFGCALVLLCCWRFCCRRGQDRRGEYRAVAAHYTGNAFDDTFDDNYSQNGDDYDDDFDDGWSSTGKRSIEMATLGDEENGGLTLEEMNG